MRHSNTSKTTIAKDTLIPTETIEQSIFLLRGHRVMLDRHLAGLYDVSTKALNQAVKRNSDRFPEDFVFRLTKAERDEVVTICDHLRPLKFSRTLPNAFTENGVAMLSSVLRTRRAILVNIQIMRTFTRLRQLISTHKELAEKIRELELRSSAHDHQITAIFEAIRKLITPPASKKKLIGFRPNP